MCTGKLLVHSVPCCPFSFRMFLYPFVLFSLHYVNGINKMMMMNNFLQAEKPSKNLRVSDRKPMKTTCWFSCRKVCFGCDFDPLSTVRGDLTWRHASFLVMTLLLIVGIFVFWQWRTMADLPPSQHYYMLVVCRHWILCCIFISCCRNDVLLQPRFLKRNVKTLAENIRLRCFPA